MGLANLKTRKNEGQELHLELEVTGTQNALLCDMS